MDIHLGKKVRYQMGVKGLSVKQLAAALGRSREGIYKIRNMQYIQPKLLAALSKALDHNFFQYYYDYYESIEIEFLREENARLEKKNRELKKKEFALGEQIRKLQSQS